MKAITIKKRIEERGIKKKFIAKEIGISDVLLSYYLMKKGKCRNISRQGLEAF